MMPPLLADGAGIEGLSLGPLLTPGTMAKQIQGPMAKQIQGTMAKLRLGAMAKLDGVERRHGKNN